MPGLYGVWLFLLHFFQKRLIITSVGGRYWGDYMLKAAIIDDSDIDRTLIRLFLTKYSEERRVFFEISEYKSAEDFFASGQRDVQLAFLDIYMEGINGIELGRTIREKDRDIVIVLVSGSNEYASEAFEIQADYYLKKPIARELFDKCMQNVLCKTFDRTYVEIYTGRKPVKVFVQDIFYVETGGRKLILHTVDGDYETYMPISSFLKMVPESLFVRTSRFEAVSLLHTERINVDDIFMENGQQLTLSPKMSDEVREAFHRYRVNYEGFDKTFRLIKTKA